MPRPTSFPYESELSVLLPPIFSQVVVTLSKQSQQPFLVFPRDAQNKCTLRTSLTFRKRSHYNHLHSPLGAPVQGFDCSAIHVIWVSRAAWLGLQCAACNAAWHGCPPLQPGRFLRKRAPLQLLVALCAGRQGPTRGPWGFGLGAGGEGTALGLSQHGYGVTAR